MLGGKSPGMTILWIWTIGTAAILVTNVARTRLRDMEKLIQDEANQTQSTTPSDPPLDALIEDDS